MNQLLVVAFDHFDDARNAIKSLRALEREGRIRFEDTALVERDPDGTAHVKNELSGTTEKAAVIGALIGAFVDDVKKTLRPGRSALFLVVKHTDADAVFAALRQFKGDVIQTTLDSEREEALRQALE